MVGIFFCSKKRGELMERTLEKIRGKDERRITIACVFNQRYSEWNKSTKRKKESAI